jgi:WD40 repeat protein
VSCRLLLTATCLAAIAWPGACAGPAAARGKKAPGAKEAAHTDALGDPLPEGALTRLGSTRFSQIGWVRSLVFAPDGRSVFVGSDYFELSKDSNPRQDSRAVRLFEVPSGQQLAEFGDQAWGVGELALCPEGRTLASAGRDGTIRLWEVATRRQVRQLGPFAEDYTWPVAWSPDLATLAVGGDQVRLWRAADGKLVHQLGDESTSAASVAFSPDGHLLATADRKGEFVRLWEVATGKPVARIKAGRNTKVAFAPNGRILAAGDDSGTIRLWAVPSGQLQRTLPGRGSSTESLAFAPDGNAMAAACGDARVRL